MSALMHEFHIARPRSTKDAVAAHREHAGSRFIAGGTDLLVNMRHGLGRADLLIDLSGIDELATIELDGNGARIGAAVTLAALARHEAIAARLSGSDAGRRGNRRARPSRLGHGRRQSLSGHALHLLQSERMVAAKPTASASKNEAMYATLRRRVVAATPLSRATSRRPCWHSAPRRRSRAPMAAGAFRSATFMSRTAGRILHLPRMSL